ncbi:sigma-70 family RNA polymerase sigma factor [Streptomyces varsoviensis]|uniref:RNA polymerase sigma factor n=1 Tax=Streptomyces varsoviensis TaxID=67373 RepID=UPI0033F39C36
MISQAIPQISPPVAGTEADLVARVRGGDVDAFATLYRAHRPMVFAFVLLRVHHWATAEDITSEAFARALKSVGRLTPDSRFGAWVTTIARNIVADHVKYTSRRPEVLLSSGYISEVLDAERDLSAEEYVLRGMSASEVRAAIDELTPLQAWCVELRYLDELSCSEIAAVLDREDGTVRALLHRAVRKLARIMAAGSAVAA